MNGHSQLERGRYANMVTTVATTTVPIIMNDRPPFANHPLERFHFFEMTVIFFPSFVWIILSMLFSFDVF